MALVSVGAREVCAGAKAPVRAAATHLARPLAEGLSGTWAIVALLTPSGSGTVAVDGVSRIIAFGSGPSLIPSAGCPAPLDGAGTRAAIAPASAVLTLLAALATAAKEEPTTPSRWSFALAVAVRPVAEPSTPCPAPARGAHLVATASSYQAASG